MILIFSLLVIFFTLSRLIVQKQLKEESNEETFRHPRIHQHCAECQCTTFMESIR